MQKRRTRMYEPWGYREENNYQSSENIREDDLSSFFAGVEYKRSDNKIHFSNKNGEEVGSLNVNDFIKSDQIVEKAWYEDGKIYVKFTNGDLITIDVKELLDENEFKDGLQVIDGIVSVLKDPTSERWLTVSSNGVKVSGIQAEIDRLDGRIDDEIARATSEEQRIEAKLDAEITRSTDEDVRIEGKLDDEIARAKEAEAGLSRRIDTLNDELDAEEAIREAADAALGRRIDQEIDDREADVDEEEARAISAETALQTAIANEATRAQEVETQLWGGINGEIARAQEVEGQLWTAVNGESERAQAAEEALDEKIDGAVSGIVDAIDAEIDDRKAEAVASAAYDSSAKTINFFNANGVSISSIDATDFVKDGMIDDVKIENGKLIIVFNTDSGKETIEIPLTDIFDPSNYYTKAETDENIATEASARTAGDNALEAEIGALSTVVETVDGRVDTEMARALSAETDLQDAIDAEAARAISAETDIEIALSGKADADAVYTQEEVDALLLAKENEIYNLTKIVGDIGGAVTYDLPNPAGKQFNTLMNNNGTVKLTDDVTTGRFGPGMTAKNKVKLNLNNNDLTVTGLTITTTQGAIMARGTEEITIYGKGTIDAGNGICIQGNGADSVINLTGSTTVYQNDRSGGELIYCYAGTINITNGTFKNLGDDKTFMLNCYDTNYRAGTAKIIVTGGKFYDFDPGNNTAEGPGTSFLAEGYHTEASTVIEEGVEHTVYTVKKDA